MKTFKKFLVQTNTLVAIFVGLGFLGMAILLLLFPGGVSNNPFQAILFFLTFFFFGCAGLPMIIRKEYTLFNLPMTGIIPTIIGFLFLVSGWFIAAIALIKVSQLLFH